MKPAAPPSPSPWAELAPPRSASSFPDRPAVPVGPISFRSSGATCTYHSGTASADAGGGCGSSSSSSSATKAGLLLRSSQGHHACPRSISQDLLSMYEESTLADVEVQCMGQKFWAHRLVLAARSPVFKAMFLTGMRENRAGVLNLEDVSADAVKCMMDFLYKDDCLDIDEASVLDTLKLANMYDIPGMRDTCLDFMARHARSDNIVSFLAACDSYSLLEFKHLLLMALVDNPSALHECIHGHSLDSHPELMKELLTICAHQMSSGRACKDRHVVKHFDGLPYRSRCCLCLREVANMPKQMLGEMLFPMVQKMRPEDAGKITGMIIELNNLELVPLFESESALRSKVEEAILVLREADRAEDSQHQLVEC